MAAPSVTGVDLGFAEKTDNKLLSHLFCSKIGGKPAWLALSKIPGLETIGCGVCKQPCVFLLQVYAPWDDNRQCFHRTLFVFVCKNPSCNKGNEGLNLIALRSQLSRDNDFYSFAPPDEDDDDYPRAEKYQSLCCLCGCAGSKSCAKCRSVSYCCREHQVIDWKAGHKRKCGKGEQNEDHQNSWMFPEYELFTEPEELDSDSDEEKSEEAKMKDYKEFMKAAKPESSLLAGTGLEKDLENMALSDETVDEQFVAFKKRTSPDPEQVLRYERRGQPLWISSDEQPTPEDIPACSCGAKRSFEFQIMPQLLNHLNLDKLGESVDWGTLVVYTCSESCDSDQNYKPEFVWKQTFSSCEIQNRPTAKQK